MLPPQQLFPFLEFGQIALIKNILETAALFALQRLLAFRYFCLIAFNG